MSTANVVGVALSSLYGVTIGIMAIAHVRGRTLVVFATGGAAVLGLYWSFGRHLFS
jgi:hypothetical protein